MEPAVEPFAGVLDRARFAGGALPVVANVDARPHQAAGDWPEVLRAQLTSPVRWRETVATLAGMGITQVTELGASAVLTGLVKRTDRSLGRQTIIEPSDLVQAEASL
jgi:[acyl-carrier-protein] S-malonyltransferase